MQILTSNKGLGFLDVSKSNLQISQAEELAVESHFSRQERCAFAKVPAHLQNEKSSSFESPS